MVAVGAAATIVPCADDGRTGPEVTPPDPAQVAEGRDIFRHDTFGDEKYWTDTLRMHEVIQKAATPRAALGVGLQVDVDALPQGVRDALAAGQVNLDDPAVTVALLKLDAVLGLKGTVQAVAGRVIRWYGSGSPVRSVTPRWMTRSRQASGSGWMGGPTRS